MKLEWYFDYISPFSYLQWTHQLPLVDNFEIELKPILFAGLLKHWGHKGPAEIGPKRRVTYRHVIWLAGRLGVPFRLPPAHPFNPLPLLRSSIACGNRPEVVDRLFGFVWREGHMPSEENAWRQLMKALDITEAAIEAPAVKKQLLANGEEAIAKGVFGVPSFAIDGEVFWGVDGFDLFREYLDDPNVIATPAMRTAGELPSGV